LIENFTTGDVANSLFKRLAGDNGKKKRTGNYSAASFESGFPGIKAAGS
jgi:hypothetical protein